MQTDQFYWVPEGGWHPALDGVNNASNLVLCFGPAHVFAQHLNTLKTSFPNAVVVGCTTAGEIMADHVRDNSLSVTSIAFKKGKVLAKQLKVSEFESSLSAGRALANKLPHESLRHVLIFSDGLCVNGTDLALGLTQKLPEHVSVSGGLAGDGNQFSNTATWLNDLPQSGHIVAVGLYGESLSFAYSSVGGWDPFGPDRLVTRADTNVLYELDGCSALELYKEYLGPHAKGLPGSALLFPLSIRADTENEERVRTILAVDEETGSMTFAGDIPQGCYVRLMRANFDRLIEGASIAAQQATLSCDQSFSLLISCVGRKMVLKQRIEEEVEGVRHVLGPQVYMGGFYSYGELSPLRDKVGCTLHNQTMTITSIGER
jgi:hypothetical protein